MSAALAVGCGGDREPAAGSRSAGDTAAPGAGTAAAVAAAGPEVTTRGIGPLRAGMTVAAASAALHGALVVPADADTTGCYYAAWRGGPAGVRVMVEGGRIARVDVDAVGIRTAAGVRVGDAGAEVQRLYDGRAVVSPHKYEDGQYLEVRDTADSGFAIVFETGAGKVTRYRAGRRPQVEYVEGCS